MDQYQKKALIIGLITLLLIGGVFWSTFRMLSPILGFRCKVVQTWSIDSVRIHLNRCGTWTSPKVELHNVFINGVETELIPSVVDSGHYVVKPGNNIMIHFWRDGRIEYDNPSQVDSLVNVYLNHYRSESQLADSIKLSYMTKRATRMNRTFIEVDIGIHHPDRWEHLTWIYIATDHWQIFEYDVLEDELIAFPNGKRY